MWMEKRCRSPLYQKAINTWTNLDIIKMQTALHNQLNYLALYERSCAQLNSVPQIVIQKLMSAVDYKILELKDEVEIKCMN